MANGLQGIKPLRTPKLAGVKNIGAPSHPARSPNWLGESTAIPKSTTAVRLAGPQAPIKNVSAKMRKPGMRKRGMIK